MSGLRGLNLVGRLNEANGTTIAARAVIAALQRGGVPLALYNVPNHDLGRASFTTPDIPQAECLADLPYETTLFLETPEMLFKILERVDDFFDERLTATIIYWELSRLPLAWHEGFRRITTLFGGSNFVQGNLSRALQREVYTIPVVPMHHLTPPTATEREQRPFTVFFSYDPLSGEERKNPSGTINAFISAFGDRQDVRLNIKAWTGANYLFNAELMQRLQQDHPTISLICEDMSYAESLALVRSSDCYLSLHRSEGLGLGLLEAMSFGKPIVATDFGGSTDFVESRCGFPIPYQLVPVQSPIRVYQASALGGQALWAEPDVLSAATALRTLADRPDLYRVLSNGARAAYAEREAALLSLDWLAPLEEAAAGHPRTFAMMGEHNA